MGVNILRHSQLPVLFLLTVYSFLIFGCKEYNRSDFSIDHLVISMCKVVSCVVGRGCLLWPVRSLGKTLLAFAMLHFVLLGQICLLFQVSLDFLHLHSSPLYWKDIFFSSWLNGRFSVHMLSPNPLPGKNFCHVNHRNCKVPKRASRMTLQRQFHSHVLSFAEMPEDLLYTHLNTTIYIS